MQARGDRKEIETEVKQLTSLSVDGIIQILWLRADLGCRLLICDALTRDTISWIVVLLL